MKQTYSIKGMTCQNCKAKVAESLNSINGVTLVDVNLDLKEVEIHMKSSIGIKTFQNNLPDKYIIIDKNENITSTEFEEESKFSQLKPLFLILLYIAATAILLHKEEWNVNEMMIDFMGIFFIVFSFFKLLDLKGFSMTFIMYDPLAHRISFYAKIYPFIEVMLGLMLLMRFEIEIAIMASIIILGITTIGVTKALLSKRKIKCACLGTALDLPMTEATFIENILMLFMSAFLLMT